MSQGFTNHLFDASAYRPGGTDVAVADGGTNLSSYTAGDLIYASGATTLSKLAKGTKYQLLRMNSGATAPEWYSGRETLTAARTYYVRTDGSDSNDGLANTSGGAFLTLQKAADVVYGTIDLGGYDVVVQVGDGTYTAGMSILSPQVGAGMVTIQGNSGTPTNVIISVTSGTCFTVKNTAKVTVKDMKLSTTTSGDCLFGTQGIIYHSGCDFGACAGQHIYGDVMSRIEATGNYTISGGAARHLFAAVLSDVRVQSRTVTLSGTISFTYFANATRGAYIWSNSSTWTGGTITGQRYNVDHLAEINTLGGGSTHFPGNSAGVADATTYGMYN